MYNFTKYLTTKCTKRIQFTTPIYCLLTGSQKGLRQNHNMNKSQNNPLLQPNFLAGDIFRLDRTIDLAMRIVSEVFTTTMKNLISHQNHVTALYQYSCWGVSIIWTNVQKLVILHTIQYGKFKLFRIVTIRVHFMCITMCRLWCQKFGVRLEHTIILPRWVHVLYEATRG